ncbi:MAG: hypothetical protein GYB68_07845, partial [Chloroflexi bacterium]|nr:hypothetical protein [Chloroflexota bacterium]
GEVLIGPLDHGGRVLHATWNRDESQIMTTGTNSLALVWDATTGDLLFELMGHIGSVIFAEWSPEGDSIITSGEDSTTRIWEADGGNEIFSLTNFRGNQGALFGASSDQVINPNDLGRIDIWNVNVDELVSLAEERLTQFDIPIPDPLEVESELSTDE